MFEYYGDYEEEEEIPKKYNYKKYIIILIIVFILFVVGMSFLTGKKSYSSYEEKMIKSAIKYISNNNVITSKEKYINVSKLNVSLPSNCSLTSGVIYNGDGYKAYLVCSDYESKIVDNTSQSITLIGNEVDIILKGMDYYDLGYVTNHDVVVAGNVKDEEGVYNLHYILDNNEYVTRKVIVIDDNSLLKYFPTIY